MVPQVYRWLAANGAGRALLELPLAGPSEAGRRMYFSTYHWLPTVDGYSAYPPMTRDLSWRISYGLPGEAALQQLVDLADIGWVVVHLDEMPPAARRAWEGHLPPGLERVGRDLLLRLTRPVRNDARARLVGTRETLGGVPIAPLGERCPGRIRARLLDDEPIAPGETFRIDVQVENLGDQPWPAFGMYPRHLVRLTATMRDASGRAEPARSLPIWRDLLPDQRTPVRATLTAPPARPGSYVVELGLAQDGRSLARCGTHPVELTGEVRRAPRPARPPGAYARRPGEAPSEAEEARQSGLFSRLTPRPDATLCIDSSLTLPLPSPSPNLGPDPDVVPLAALDGSPPADPPQGSTRNIRSALQAFWRVGAHRAVDAGIDRAFLGHGIGEL